MSVAEMPPLWMGAKDTAPIRTFDVIVDGQVDQTLTLLDRQLDSSVPLSLEGQHYVYIRPQQCDANQTLSSPIWVTNCS